MKRFQKLIAAALMTGCIVTAFTGCSSGGGSKVKVGLSLDTLHEERWVRDKEKIEELAGSKGFDLLVQIANLDTEAQIAQCDTLLSEGIDVLILAPHDAEGAAVIVEKAVKAGVRVICYDRLVMNCSPDVYISFDNIKVGELQGKYLSENVPKGNIVFLSGAPTDNNSKLYKQGAAKYIQPKVDIGDYKIVLEQSVKDWKPEEAMKLMEQAFKSNENNIQGVIAPNDNTAGGCIQVMASQNLAGRIPITGQDAELTAARRIVAGTQSMTVFKDTRALATAAVEAALKLARGQKLESADQTVNNNKIDVPSILLTPVSVDRNNLDKELIESGYLVKEDVYGK